MKRSLFFVVVIFTACTCTKTTYCQGRISVDTIKKMILADWQYARDYTIDYMKAMPKDKFSFKAKDSITSFARQLMRLAESNILFVSDVTGAKPILTDSRTHTSDAINADFVIHYVISSYDFAIGEITKLPASSLLEPITLTVGQSSTLSRLSWLQKAFDKQTWQRARINVYLKQAGVTLPEESRYPQRRLRRGYFRLLV